MSERPPIKVLQVLDKLGVGGSNVHGVSRAVTWWLPRFDPKAFQFHVCSLRAPEKGVEIFEKAGIDVTFLSKGKLDPTTLPALFGVIARERPDVLHLHGYGATNFGRLAGFLKGIPRIVHEHAILPNQPIYQTIADLVLSPLTTKAIAISDPVRDFMITRRKVSPRLIETLFVGVPLEDFQVPNDEVLAAVREEFKISTNEQVVCTVGRLDTEKGQIYLLEAAAKVLRELPSVRFLIVGDGPDLSNLQSSAKKLSIEHRITFSGYRQDVPVLLAMSNIVAVPSLREGGPLVVFEAMVMGKPTIGTSVGLMPAAIHDGDNGFLVPTEDSRTLAEKLIILLRDPALARRMGERGKARSKAYDVSKTVERLAEIYRELARPNHPSP